MPQLAARTDSPAAMSVSKYWDTSVFPLITDTNDKPRKTLKEDWPKMMNDSLIFCGYEPKVFGELIIIVKQHIKNNRISTVSITRFGTSYYPNLMVDARSRFWPACENLLPQDQREPVKRALAITALKNYSKLINNRLLIDEEVTSLPWDETDAGNLASDMRQITTSSTNEFATYFLERGVLQNQSIYSYMIDVLYDTDVAANQKASEQNNKLISLLGEQLEQIFDPLLEYSPEDVNIAYSPPSADDFSYPRCHSQPSITAVVDELLEVQRSFSLKLVKLLQDLIIPLRIHVLSAAAELGIQKINRVFPPTIDEVTRINCILQDSLQRAAPFGYVEIIKVLGTIVPYFYKAMIRHEANMRSFLQHFNEFYEKNREHVFENRLINKGSYTLREIDAIVSGSLVQLPKLKLLMVRLRGAIQEERAKSFNFELDSSEDMAVIEFHLENALKVIDAFGLQEDASMAVDVSKRIFTPTGKILTELASSWPAELQYGWLTRKVVGIFELRNLEPKDPFHFLDVVVIFSDKILVLTIIDDAYYHSKEAGKHMKVADILLHSLVNGKPLPDISSIATMQVSSWCDINKVHASCFSIAHEHGSRRFLQFTGFDDVNNRYLQMKDFPRIQYFEVFDNSSSLQEISDLVNKAKILHKNQPFHLFRSFGKSKAFFTAQLTDSYKLERSRSPIAIVLNTNFDNLRGIFQEFPNLVLLIQLCIDADEKIYVEMCSRDSQEHTIKIMNRELLHETLSEMIECSFPSVFGSSLLQTCQSKLEGLIKGYRGQFFDDLKLGITALTSQDRSQNLKADQDQMLKSILKKPARDQVNTEQIQNKSEKLGFFARIVSRLRKKKQEKPLATGIPPATQGKIEFEGSKIEYKRILSPSPSLGRIVDSEPKEERADLLPQNEYERSLRYEGNPQRNSIVDNSTTGVGSIDADSNFQFPLVPSSSNHTTFLLEKDVLYDEPRSKIKPEVLSSKSEEKIHQLTIEDARFDEFLVRYLYNDGEANWTAISKFDDSNLSKEISTLKQLTSMDSHEVIEIESQGSQYDDSSFSEIAAMADKYDDVVVELPERDWKAGKVAPRSFSSQSITPSIAAYELGKAMEFNFSANSVGLTTSEDEYYSTEEQMATEPLRAQMTPESACLSEDTIVIDSIPTKFDEPKLVLAEETYFANENSVSTMNKEGSFYLGNFESIAYLSKLLSDT